MSTMPAKLTRDLQDKRLRVEFVDGEIADIKVLLVSECSEHADCRGFVYDLISTNRPHDVRKGSANWANVAEIQRLEIIGD